MNVFDGAARRWRKSRKRGVSPIIATILLVAITVVLAAVLYVLISGLTHTGASTPYALEMTSPQSYTNPSAGVYYAFIYITPTTGLTTGMFGLSLEASNNLPTGTIGTAVAACKWVAGGTAYTVCVAPATGTWYGVLYWQGNGSVASVYTSGGWSNTWPTTPAQELLIVSSASLQGSSDTMNAFSTGSSTVTGQSGPF